MVIENKKHPVRTTVLVAVLVTCLVVGVVLAVNWDRVQNLEQRAEEKIAVGSSAQSPEPAATAVQPAPAPSFGALTVKNEESVGQRSTRYKVETPLVAAAETQDGPSVIVTLPPDYDSDREYPVLYLLTGTADGEAPLAWVKSGAVEDATADLDAIVVSVDDGSYGWYTDWTVPGDEPRAWRSFHLDQVIPWVDSTFPTLDDPSGRAVAGASAGGFGAMSYAQARPDLFGTAASFSGLLSFEDASHRQDIMGETYEASGSANSLFGDGQRTTQADWDAHDPSLHTDQLADTPLWIYSGSGNDYEAALQTTSRTFASAAQGSGAQVTERTYAELNDAGANAPAGTCGEGHEWTCWSMALEDWVPDLQAFFDRG